MIEHLVSMLKCLSAGFCQRCLGSRLKARIHFRCLFLISLICRHPPKPPPKTNHQIRRSRLHRSVLVGEACALISCALTRTEKELRGAEMLLLLAKLIHLHGTLGPWQFRDKSREMPAQAGRRCPRLSV